MRARPATATHDKRLNANHIAKMVGIKARFDDDGNAVAQPVQAEDQHAGQTQPAETSDEIMAEIERRIQQQIARKAWAR